MIARIFLKKIIPRYDLVSDPSCNRGFRLPIAPHLKQLNMKYMNFKIDLPIFYAISDQECLLANNVVSIDISHSYLSGVSDKILSLFYKLGNVNTILMRAVDIPILNDQSLPYLQNVQSLIIGEHSGQIMDNLTICSFVHELKVLDVSQSKLKNIPEHLFMNCTSLIYVDLSQNSLSYLPQSVRYDFERNSLDHSLTVDLSNNMLTCLFHIEAHGTISWIHTSDIRFLNHETYRCLGHEGFEMVIDKNLDKYSDLCNSQNKSLIRIIFISVMSSVMLWLFIVMLFVLHKYRYRIKTYYFKVKQMYRLCFIDNNIMIQVKPVYDVYISSCLNDIQFIQLRLLPELEEKNGLKCCVPDRDFPASGISFDLITEHMILSKTVLIVLSKASLSNVYTQYERKLAKSREIRGMLPRRVIYVVLEELVLCSDTEILSILDSKMYIKWPYISHESRKEKSEQKRVFERIVSEIQEGLLDGISINNGTNNEEEIELNLNRISVN